MPTPKTAGELVRGVSTPLIHSFMRRRLSFATGLDNIPRQGPVVVVANHSSYLDHFAMLTVLHAVRGGDVWFPTKSESFEKFASRVWHESMRCYPVDRTTPGEQVFDIAQDILADDGVLVLYPEGTRGDGTTLLPFKTGAFRMALAAGATVVPVGMRGLSEILPKGVHVPRPGLYSLAVGAPMDVPDVPDLRDRGRSMRDEAVVRITELRERAGDPDSVAVTAAVDDLVGLAGQITAENMTTDGLLPADVLGRLTQLMGLAEAMAGHHPALELQQNRVRGFRALNARGPGRLVRVVGTHWHAVKASGNYTRSDVAAYLAARTSLMLPSILGGGPHRAARYFTEAAERGGDMTSQAYAGLAESLLATQDCSGAVQAYHRALDTIGTDDPRGGLRRDRITRQLAELGESGEVDNA